MSYSIWKLVDRDDWWWNLNLRKVRIDIFPICNDTRVLLGLFARISPGHWAMCPEWASLQLKAPPLLSAEREIVFSVRMIYVHEYALWATFIVHWGDFWWFCGCCLSALQGSCPICGQFHGCESLFVLVADANVLLRVIKSQSTENTGDLLIKIAYLC